MKSRVLFWTVKYNVPIRHPNRVISRKLDIWEDHRDVNLDALAYRCYLKLCNWSNHMGISIRQRKKQLQYVPALRGQEEAEDPAKEIKEG